MKLDRMIAVRNTKTIYRTGRTCIKVFMNAKDDPEVFQEALNTTLMANTTDLNVPNVHEVSKVNGNWAIITEYIKGEPLDNLLQEHPELEEEYLRRFSRLHVEMHKYQCGELRTLRMFARKRLNKMNLPANLEAEIWGKIANEENVFAVCHGDYVPSNIIVTDEGKWFIIDWSQAGQGNAYADAATSYLLMLMDNQDTWADKYLRYYCEEAGITTDTVRDWMKAAAIYGFSAANYDRRQFLRNWMEKEYAGGKEE